MPENVNLPATPGEGEGPQPGQPIVENGTTFQRDEVSLGVLDGLIEVVGDAHTAIDTQLESFANAAYYNATIQTPHAQAVIKAFQKVSNLMSKAGLTLNAMRVFFGDEFKGALAVSMPFAGPKYPVGTWVKYNGPRDVYKVLPLQVIEVMDTSKGAYDYEYHYKLEVQNTRTVVGWIPESELEVLAPPNTFSPTNLEPVAPGTPLVENFSEAENEGQRFAGESEGY